MTDGKKERLDVLLVKQGLFCSRERAKSEVKAGNVTVNGETETKPGEFVYTDSVLVVKESALSFVSRGGLKLQKALDSFAIDLTKKVCMDVGASTGGFTDCMLKHQAVRVYSVDVGTDQLSEQLRTNPSVISMEKTNIRYSEPSDFPEQMDFISIDVSFISLTKVLLPVRNLLKTDGFLVALIKPQFEAGKQRVGKKGVVYDADVQKEVIFEVISFAVSIGYLLQGLTFSPIRGPEGNIEFLLYLQKKDNTSKKTPDEQRLMEQTRKIVEEAHGVLV